MGGAGSGSHETMCRFTIPQLYGYFTEPACCTKLVKQEFLDGPFKTEGPVAAAVAAPQLTAAPRPRAATTMQQLAAAGLWGW